MTISRRDVLLGATAAAALAPIAARAEAADVPIGIIYPLSGSNAQTGADAQKGRAETERLITQEKVCAVIGTYQSAVAVTVSQVCERYQIPFISADNSSPSLHRRGLKFYFRAAPHDEMYGIW